MRYYQLTAFTRTTAGFMQPHDMPSPGPLQRRVLALAVGPYITDSPVWFLRCCRWTITVGRAPTYHLVTDFSASRVLGLAPRCTRAICRLPVVGYLGSLRGAAPYTVLAQLDTGSTTLRSCSRSPVGLTGDDVYVRWMDYYTTAPHGLPRQLAGRVARRSCG